MTPGCSDTGLAETPGTPAALVQNHGRVEPRAYDELYLGTARVALGRMLDYAVNELSYDLGGFWSLFLASEVSRRFEFGDASLTVGHSGTELAWLVMEGVGVKTVPGPSRRCEAGRSEEYWCGWALAYYQWCRAARFVDIDARVSVEAVRDLYDPYHEMDIRQFVDRMDEECLGGMGQTALQRRRKLAGLSQSQLARASGVSVRTIQQYEQRQKRINHARAAQVAALARALHCGMEDLLEPLYVTQEVSF